jgi:hypothetical protein
MLIITKMRQFDVIFDKYNVVKIYSSGKYTQKWIIKLYNYCCVVRALLFVGFGELERRQVSEVLPRTSCLFSIQPYAGTIRDAIQVPSERIISP